MEAVHIQERPQLNDEIENAFLECAGHARSILAYSQMERGTTVLTLYDNFFKEFSMLVLLTSDLPQLRNAEKEVAAAQSWLYKKGVVPLDDDELFARCREGVSVFLAFKRVISSQGVISLPSS